MVVPDRPENEGPPHHPSGHRWGMLVAATLAGLLIVWLFGFTADSQSPSASTNDLGSLLVSPTSSHAGSPITPSTLSGETTIHGSAPSSGRLEPLPGITDLEGTIALTAPGPLDRQNLWVIRPGGRMVHRADAPIIGRGHRHSLMVVGDYVVFTNDHGTFRAPIDLAEPPQRVAESGLLIPDADSSRVWLVGRDLTKWFAPIEGETGDVGARTELPRGFRWPFTGYEGGVLFQPENVADYGRVAYWPVAGEPEPLGIDFERQSGLRSVVGHRAAVVTAGPTVTILDLHTSRETTAIAFDPEGGIAVEACLSEDGSHLAVISSAGKVEVFETATGASLGRVSTSDPPWSVGWTGPQQLVYLEPIGVGTSLSLQSFDLTTGMSTAMARLEASELWRIATGSRPC